MRSTMSIRVFSVFLALILFSSSFLQGPFSQIQISPEDILQCLLALCNNLLSDLWNWDSIRCNRGFYFTIKSWDAMDHWLLLFVFEIILCICFQLCYRPSWCGDEMWICDWSLLSKSVSYLRYWMLRLHTLIIFSIWKRKFKAKFSLWEIVVRIWIVLWVEIVETLY